LGAKEFKSSTMSREEHEKWATNALKVKSLIIKIIPWRV